LATKKILVIEDEEDIRSYIMTFFEDNGFQTLGAGNGEEGLRLAKKEAPDLITLDISMPEKSGMKTLRELQDGAGTSAIPVVIVTGVSDELKMYIEQRKHLKPPAGYVFKPIQTQELLETVKRLLA
jgi:DNA-binding response OmpR family regulator